MAMSSIELKNHAKNILIIQKNDLEKTCLQTRTLKESSTTTDYFEIKLKNLLDETVRICGFEKSASVLLDYFR